MRKIGLSIPQFDVLSALSQGAGITQRELAQKLFVTKGNVSGLIDRLVEAGLVERRRGAKDRRSHSLFLTREGKAFAAAGFAVQKDFLREDLRPACRARDLALLHLLLGRWRDAAREAEGAGATKDNDIARVARAAARPSRARRQVKALFTIAERGSKLGHRRVEFGP